MAKLEEKARKFLDESPYVGVVTTLREDGSPHATIVWVDVEGDKVSFNTALGRAKPKHLKHDPRASVLMVSPAQTGSPQTNSCPPCTIIVKLIPTSGSSTAGPTAPAE